MYLNIAWNFRNLAFRFAILAVEIISNVICFKQVKSTKREFVSRVSDRQQIPEYQYQETYCKTGKNIYTSHLTSIPPIFRVVLLSENHKSIWRLFCKPRGRDSYSLLPVLSINVLLTLYGVLRVYIAIYNLGSKHALLLFSSSRSGFVILPILHTMRF